MRRFSSLELEKFPKFQDILDNEEKIQKLMSNKKKYLVRLSTDMKNQENWSFLNKNSNQISLQNSQLVIPETNR